MSIARERRRWLAHLDSEHRQQTVRARALRVDPALLRLAHDLWLVDAHRRHCGIETGPALRAVNDAVHAGIRQGDLATLLRGVPAERPPVTRQHTRVYTQGGLKPWVSTFISGFTTSVQGHHLWHQEPVLLAWDVQFDWADEYLAYHRSGLADEAPNAVLHRVPFAIGQTISITYGVTERFAGLVRACEADAARVAAHVPLLMACRDLRDASIGDLVAWTEKAGQDRAIRYARAGFTLDEGLACTVDDDTLDTFVALQGADHG